MLDETKPRLIVMEGTTEPGVFQVEILKCSIGVVEGNGERMTPFNAASLSLTR